MVGAGGIQTCLHPLYHCTMDASFAEHSIICLIPEHIWTALSVSRILFNSQHIIALKPHQGNTKNMILGQNMLDLNQYQIT